MYSLAHMSRTTILQTGKKKLNGLSLQKKTAKYWSSANTLLMVNNIIHPIKTSLGKRAAYALG